MSDIGDLARAMLRRTIDGKMEWMPQDGAFQAVVGDNLVTIESNDALRYILTVRNLEGEALDRLSAEDENGHEEGTLQELHRLARRRALKVDETLHKMKRELGTL